MNIFVSGVNYKTTPLEIREKLSFGIEEQKLVLKEVSENECVFLSTCNRTEIYIYSEDRDFEMDVVERLLCKIKGLNIYDLKKYFYVYTGLKAVKHLFRVACGLDSLVLGEDQILGQIKSAHELSLELKTSAGVLNTLFRHAVTAAKKVKTSTELSRNSLSVGSLAIKLLSDIFNGNLENKCALIIGTGKMGTIALKNLTAKGIGKVYITNRTHCRADSLSRDYGNVECVDYNNRYSVIDACDIVISSTSSPHYTITRDMLESSVKAGKERVFFDLAVPRDFDTAVRDFPGVKYYSIDDLKAAADENIDRRLVEAGKAEDMISEYVLEFERWYQFRGVLPVVREIQKFSEGILNERISQTLSKLKCASEEDKEVVKASITGAVNGILNKFIYSVREYGSKEDMEVYFRCLREALKEPQ